MSIFTPYATDETDAAGIPRFGGDRCAMDVDDTLLEDRGPGFKGIVIDRITSTKWKVFGAECGLPGCYCGARVERMPYIPFTKTPKEA